MIFNCFKARGLKWNWLIIQGLNIKLTLIMYKCDPRKITMDPILTKNLVRTDACSTCLLAKTTTGHGKETNKICKNNNKICI